LARRLKCVAAPNCLARTVCFTWLQYTADIYIVSLIRLQCVYALKC